MNTRKIICLFFSLIVLSGTVVTAQDTLPDFIARNAGNNRFVIGWVNNYTNIKQISIQRSFDSLSGYKTILTVADPTSPQNGYVDSKAPNDHMFYRLYVMLDKGIYLFSKAKKPVFDSARTKEINKIIQLDSVKKVDPLKLKLDSLLKIDSVAMPGGIAPKNKPPSYTPSLYVYTNRDGYVRIDLPANEKHKKYSIKFFEEDGTRLFEIKEIKENNFKLDKTNFYHAGWFLFELYEDGKLIEKHKFYLEKDF
ncbi:MAG: hypothetical protein WBC06_13300 [Chitinophagaceae bacterium]